MIRKLIELTILAILVAALVYLINLLGPIGADVKIIFKYLWYVFLTVAASVTIIAVVAIVFGIGWLKGITSSGSGFWDKKSSDIRIKGAKIGEYVKNTVENSIKEAFDSDYSGSSSRELSQDFDFPQNGDFTVKTANGNINISPSENQKLSVKAEIYEKENGDAYMVFESGELKIKTKSGKKAFFGDLTVFLPKNTSSISAESVNGDIKISEIYSKGDSCVKGVNGDISLSELENISSFTVKSVSGDISIVNSKMKELKVQSVSGNINAKDSFAQTAVFKTVSGDIDYGGCSFSQTSFKTVSGEIRK
ncbi:MAG: DUF4097 domain-containing protein [Elusimicrobia bacterium]|nr:DUF4097 domain-containing protein [Elusimicrobiota bacterium]